MDAYIPVTFEFEADFDTGKVAMRARNVETLGSTRAVFGPNQLDAEFMDELVKRLVRKPNRFQEISGNFISEETRMRLRQQLAHDQYKRQIEAASGDVGPEPVKPAAKKPAPKKKGLLRSLFKS